MKILFLILTNCLSIVYSFGQNVPDPNEKPYVPTKEERARISLDSNFSVWRSKPKLANFQILDHSGKEVVGADVRLNGIPCQVVKIKNYKTKKEVLVYQIDMNQVTIGKAPNLHTIGDFGLIFSNITLYVQHPDFNDFQQNNLQTYFAPESKYCGPTGTPDGTFGGETIYLVSKKSAYIHLQNRQVPIQSYQREVLGVQFRNYPEQYQRFIKTLDSLNLEIRDSIITDCSSPEAKKLLKTQHIPLYQTYLVGKKNKEAFATENCPELAALRQATIIESNFKHSELQDIMGIYTVGNVIDIDRKKVFSPYVQIPNAIFTHSNIAYLTVRMSYQQMSDAFAEIAKHLPANCPSINCGGGKDFITATIYFPTDWTLEQINNWYADFQKKLPDSQKSRLDLTYNLFGCAYDKIKSK